MVNPDGYLYTQTDNRLWRKTRKPNGNGCFGTDANRNFGFHWGTGGSSSDPCSDTYMGSEPFSEIETANMRDWLTANKDMIKFYNNVHSYSQLILLPWGWGYDEPENNDDLYRVATLANDALFAVHQKDYEVSMKNDDCSQDIHVRLDVFLVSCMLLAEDHWTGLSESWEYLTVTGWS